MVEHYECSLFLLMGIDYVLFILLSIPLLLKYCKFDFLLSLFNLLFFIAICHCFCAFEYAAFYVFFRN